MPSLRQHPRQPARLHHSRRLGLISSPPGSFGPPPCTPPSRMRGAESARASSQPMHSKIYEDIAPYNPRMRPCSETLYLGRHRYASCTKGSP